MTTQDIEQAIRDLFPIIYNKCYQGILKVVAIIDSYDKTITGYKLILGLNKEDAPLVIACDGNAEQFLNFVQKELQTRHLEFTEYYTAIQLYEKGT